MLTDAQRDFLKGLRVEKNGTSVIEIIDVNGDGVAPVRWLSREMRYAEALEQAQLIVAACHEAATWGKVIEAAVAARRAQHAYNTAIPFTDERDKASHRAYHANKVLEAAIDAALKESSDEV